MFIDKRNLYSIFFLSGILFLVLFFSRFSFLEGLDASPTTTPETTTTPVVNGVDDTPASTTSTSNTRRSGGSTPATSTSNTTTPATSTSSNTTTPETSTSSNTTTSATSSTVPAPSNEQSSNTKLTPVNSVSTVSTETIVKISDIQTQTNNLGIIIKTDIVNLAKTGLKIIQNPSVMQALSTISDKTILTSIDTLINDGQKVYMNLNSQALQISNNLTNFTKQYQNLNL